MLQGLELAEARIARSIQRYDNRVELLKRMLLEADTKAEILRPATVELVSFLQRENFGIHLTEEMVLSIQEKLIKLPSQEAFLSFWQTQGALSLEEITQLAELFSYDKEPSLQACIKADRVYQRDCMQGRKDDAGRAENYANAATDARHLFEDEINAIKTFHQDLSCLHFVKWALDNIERLEHDEVGSPVGGLLDQEVLALLPPADADLSG